MTSFLFHFVQANKYIRHAHAEFLVQIFRSLDYGYKNLVVCICGGLESRAAPRWIWDHLAHA